MVRKHLVVVMVLAVVLAGCAAGGPVTSSSASGSGLATASRRSSPAQTEGVYLKELELEPDSPSTAPPSEEYLAQVRKLVIASWAVPRSARERGPVGELKIEFHIAPNGKLAFITLRQSSGTQSLDDAALAAVKVAQPFPPVPALGPDEKFPIRGRFRYDTVRLVPHPGQTVAELDADLSDCSSQVNTAGRSLTAVLMLDLDKFEPYRRCLTGKGYALESTRR